MTRDDAIDRHPHLKEYTTMKTFSVLVAHDVPHYGVIEVEADSADHALKILEDRPLDETMDEACNDPAYENSICARVVHIRDEHGNCSHEDTPLDNSYREWSAVEDLTAALRQAEAYLSGCDTRTTPAQLVQRINAALAKAGAA